MSRPIWLALAGWLLVIVGFAIVGTEDGHRTTDGGLMLLSGVLLLIAHALAVRFDRLHPPE